MKQRDLSFAVAATVLSGLLAGCSDSDAPDGGGDENGIKGGRYTFEVTVTDTAFAPDILESENDAAIELTLTNKGKKPHDLVIGFSPKVSVATLAAGASATVKFATPNREGIYDLRSDEPGDSLSGQYIVQ